MGTAGEADKFIYDLDLKGPMVLVMGAEGAGYAPVDPANSAIFSAKLPMAGGVSSLNVSVATGCLSCLRWCVSGARLPF